MKKSGEQMLSRLFYNPEEAPICNVGLVKITDTNLFQKTQDTPFLLE